MCKSMSTRVYEFLTDLTRGRECVHSRCVGPVLTSIWLMRRGLVESTRIGVLVVQQSPSCGRQPLCGCQPLIWTQGPESLEIRP